MVTPLAVASAFVQPCSVWSPGIGSGALCPSFGDPSFIARNTRARSASKGVPITPATYRLRLALSFRLFVQHTAPLLPNSRRDRRLMLDEMFRPRPHLDEITPSISDNSA